MLAPVIVFAYKRDKHLKSVLETLNNDRLANETELFIFQDGYKSLKDKGKVEAVKKVITEFEEESNFQNITLYESEYNKGLAKSVIDGVSKIIEKYDRVIVLEDDLLVSSDFLQFMNEGLEYYKTDNRVGAISGFCPKIRRERDGVFKARTGNSCGWGTWRRIWNIVDWNVEDYDIFRNDKNMRMRFENIQYGISDILDRQMRGEIDSWAVRWDYSFFLHNLWTVYPSVSKVQNIGFDSEGTTSINILDRRKGICAKANPYIFRQIDDMEDMTKKMAHFYKPSILEKVYDRLNKSK